MESNKYLETLGFSLAKTPPTPTIRSWPFLSENLEHPIPGQRQVLRRPRLARWDLQHKPWKLENSLCLTVPSEAGGGPPQARHRPGEQHHPIRHTLHLGLWKIDDDNSGEHGRPWHCAALPPPCWGEELHFGADEDRPDSVILYFIVYIEV